MDEKRRSVMYEVSVRGELGAATLGAFPASGATSQGGVTVLSGVLPDQAALFGVLGQVESLGLQLLGVRCVVGDRSSSDLRVSSPDLDADNS